MFYLRLGEHTLVGASPEVMVRVEGREITLRPIAGTRRRGVTEAEDRELEAELLADPKERAEHVMLVDLGRNDVGRVSEIGSVKVTELMVVERYSHVMHIVSNVVGVLRQECDAFDAFAATFPQGTVSGAPKIRAMEIIDELESVRRGVYAGAVGYFSYTGNTDTAIALRTLLIKQQPRLHPGGRRRGRGLGPRRGIRGIGQQGSRDGAGASSRARIRNRGSEVSLMSDNEKVRVLMIDNYDSFTYNLVQYLGELGADVTVKRNDAIDVAGIRALHPAAVVISPGPCTPTEAGISLTLFREMAGEVPILGVCLGLQCIGEAFGGKVVARRSPDARQDLADNSRRQDNFRRHPQSVRRDALSFADRRRRNRFRRRSKSARARQKTKSWDCVIGSTTSKACSFILNRF